MSSGDDKAIRCTIPSCACECFAPGKSSLRLCHTCQHGWVAHALDKLGFQHVIQLGMSVEVVQPNIVFDIASLMLYGTHAAPIRLKILLDRLFSVLQHDEVIQVLHGFGWSYEDYARGYILQDASGRVLDKWSIVTREEEDVIIQQFLRFGETRAIAQEIIIQGTRDRTELPRTIPKTESEIRKFIERNTFNIQSYMRSLEAHRLLGGKFMYPPGASAAAAALIGLPTLGSFPAATTGAATSASASSPAQEFPKSESSAVTSKSVTSPLNQLQTMQALDYCAEKDSPNSSPGSSTSDRHRASSSASHSPQSNPPTLATAVPLVKVPQMLPLTPFAQSSFKSHFTLPGLTPPSFGVASSSESQEVAINYSTKDTTRDPVQESYKLKHLRKSSMPLKRNWAPSGVFGHSFISPSGKKRVLCTVCNKTFCDKGALKIHYSAVHLKEMHKCTVDGCNMMFSSRRSRNRHSANPNPKLHQPQKRKIPEGATIVEDGKISSPDPRDMIEIPASAVPLHDMSPIVGKSLLQTTSLPNAIQRSIADHRRFFLEDQDEDEPDSPKRLRIDEPDEKSSKVKVEALNTSKDESVDSPHLQQRPGQEHLRGTRKRKRLVPTRYPQATEEEFVMSDNSDEDENSNEGVACGEAGSCSKGDCRPGVGCREELGANSPGYDDNFNDEVSSNGSPGEREDISFLMPEQDKPEARLADSNYFKSAAFREIQERALKQMYGIPCDSSTCDKPRNPLFMLPRNLSEGGHYDGHHPLRMSVGTQSDQESNGSSDNSDDESVSHVRRHNGDGSPPLSAAEEEEECCEIPVDRDNPNKCPACDVEFHNTFAVKTHYQSVHLQLKHTCTIDGCNAAFPSKRSRNRHSGNLNLHRKLLSTTEQGNPSPTDEFRSHFYDSAIIKKHNGHGMKADPEEITASIPTAVVLNRGLLPPQKSGSHAAVVADAHVVADNDDHSCSEFENYVKCHICNDSFRDNLVLKEHLEKVHPKDMYRCTINGCDKVFSTRKSRNRHSQNDNLHRNISPKI